MDRINKLQAIEDMDIDIKCRCPYEFNLNILSKCGTGGYEVCEDCWIKALEG